MRKLSIVLAALLASTSALAADEPIKLFQDYVYNQPVNAIKAEPGVVDCSQRGQQMLCRSDVEFAGHKDWAQVFFFNRGLLKSVALFAPVSQAHFKDAGAAIRKEDKTPIVLSDQDDKVAFDVFQALAQEKGIATLSKQMEEKETELLKGKKLSYIFVKANLLLENVKSIKNAANFFTYEAPRSLVTAEVQLDDIGVAVNFRAPMMLQEETGKSMIEEKKDGKKR